MKILIVGGVAGGAGAAAKARRMNESAEIILFERGEHISFANCGLPYHLGGVIEKRDALLVMTPQKFTGRAAVDVRTLCEVTSIDRFAKSVTVFDKRRNESYTETYDKLILATGSSPVRPPLPGLDDPDVMVLWTIPDMDRIKERIAKGVTRAVVVGGGFIGVEVAENLRELGVAVTLVEMLPQVLPPLDPEMTKPLAEQLLQHGVDLRLNAAVAGIERRADGQGGLVVKLKEGEPIEAGLVILAIGVRPNNELARAAGLDLGQRGGVKVNDRLQTSDPDIYAVGDVIEVHHPVLNAPTQIPLAGPANRQARIAAINACGGHATYRGTFGTSICKVFDVAAASVGANEKQLVAASRPFRKVYLFPASHAGYYPGSQLMAFKLLFDDAGAILGAQIVGADGVDKRIDVIATAMQSGLTVRDLAELELAYAPPYGSAKDAVNFAGFVASNVLDHETDMVAPNEIRSDDYLLDVREADEVACGAIPGANHIPLGKIRSRIAELPKDRRIVIICRVGARAYVAERILKAHGLNAATLSGGYLGWQLFQAPSARPSTPCGQAASCCSPAGGANGETPPSGMAHSAAPVATVELDACGLQCPGPIVAVRQKLETLNDGEMLRVRASDAGFYNDLPSWCASAGHELVELSKVGAEIVGVVKKRGAANASVPSAGAAAKKRTTLVLFSNDLDKSMAAMIMATGFASLGHEVSIFFTFWGLNVLRRDAPPPVEKDFLSRMFGWMMPRGAKKLALSKMHMAGMGTEMMKYVMKDKGVQSLPELMVQARALGVQFLACEMAMNVMGIRREELLDGVEPAGVAHFAALAEQSGTTLFI